MSRLHRSLVAIAMIVCLFFGWESNVDQHLISWDAFGYYLYLPATFIYHDIDLSDPWIDEVYQDYQPSSTRYQLVPQDDGGQTIKYSSGLAILYSPGFFLGHLWALLSDNPADGFSSPYETALMWWLLIFNVLGIWIFFRTIEDEFSSRVALVTTFIVVFGTNYLITAFLSLSMPHGILFTLYALLIRMSQLFARTPRLIYLFGITTTIALLTLSRPTEIISVLIPMFFLGNPFKEGGMLRRIKILWWPLVLVILLGFALVQMSYWKIAAGKWIYFSYDNPAEGLNLWSPHTWDALFSYRKGWFLWSPLCAVALLSWFWLKHPLRWGGKLFFTITIWLVTSWTTWWYAESFGQRPFVQSYPILFFAFAGLLSEIRKSSKLKQWTAAIPIALMFCLSLFQSYQFKRGILPGDRITKDYYWANFLRSKPDTSTQKLLLVDRMITEPNLDVLIDNYSLVKDTLIYNTGDLTYPFVFRLKYESLTEKDHFLMSITNYNPDQMTQNGTRFDISAFYNETYHSFRAHFPTNDTLLLLSPTMRHQDTDHVLFQMTNPNNKAIESKVLNLKFYERQNN